MSSTTIPTKIAARAFETAKRQSGEEFVRVRDDAPEWIRDMCRHAHDGMLPDDWRYRMIAAACDWLAEGAFEDEGESGMSFAASFLPVYTSDRLDWLGSHFGRPVWVDEATAEFGNSEEGILGDIALGMLAEAEEVFELVRGFLAEMADA